MSFKNNGYKRDPRFIAGGIGMLFVGVILMLLAFADAGPSSWKGITSVIILFLGVLMIKNANEM